MKKIAAAVLAACSFCAHAALEQVSGSNFSFDSSSSLYWLAPSSTAGLSFNDVTSGAWTSTGWRHATTAEVTSLFSSYGLSEGSSWSSAAAINSLVGDLGGPTQAFQTGGFALNAVTAATGTVVDRDLSKPPTYGHWVASLSDSQGWGSTTAQQYVVSDNFGADFTGHFLVNTAAVIAPVPEPETYAMMVMGLGVIGWVARRKQRRA